MLYIVLILFKLMTDFQQNKEREIAHEHSGVQLFNILKELCPILIPRNENSVSFFIKEIVEIQKTPIFTLFCSCFIFTAVMMAMLGRDVRELTFFT